MADVEEEEVDDESYWNVDGEEETMQEICAENHSQREWNARYTSSGNPVWPIILPTHIPTCDEKYKREYEILDQRIKYLGDSSLRDNLLQTLSFSKGPALLVLAHILISSRLYPVAYWATEIDESSFWVEDRTAFFDDLLFLMNKVLAGHHRELCGEEKGCNFLSNSFRRYFYRKKTDSTDLYTAKREERFNSQSQSWMVAACSLDTRGYSAKHREKKKVQRVHNPQVGVWFM